MSRRAWLIASMGLALVAAAAVAHVRQREDCGGSVTSLPASRSSSPFLDAAQRAERPDLDRDAVVAAVAKAAPPFGEVLGAVGYHYEQWAQVSAFAQGIGVRTRDNPDFTMLDDATLRPRWSVRVETRRSTYDASDRRYLVGTLPQDADPDLVALDAASGDRLWCTTLGGAVVGEDDPFATYILDDQDVTVLRPAGSTLERLSRLDADDGSQVWARDLDADAGDFLGELGPERLLVGGLAQYALLDPEALSKRPAGPALQLVSARDGKTIWTRQAPSGSGMHVLGTDSATRTAVILESAATGSARLSALDTSGRQVWAARPAGGESLDATLRSGRVLVRVGRRWSAYAVEDGRRLWSRVLPSRPQFLPYGFELDSIAMLDDEHAIFGGATAVHTMDLRTGKLTSAALPTDGISTTYWAYQVAVSPGLIAVATNTGAVVVRRAQ